MSKIKGIVSGGVLFALAGFCVVAQEQGELGVDHSECAFQGAKRQHWKKSGLEAQRARDYEYSRIAMAVARQLPAAKSERSAAAESGNVIDEHLSQAWKDLGVTPAAKTNDFEFIRRVTIDLAGRIPAALEVQTFVNDGDSEKRSKLVYGLLNSQGWVDKWTMFFGDLYKNTVRTTQLVRYAEGRTAFYQWIQKSLGENKPYDRMAAELITSATGNSYQDGASNWILGGFVTGGPAQDIADQMAVNVAETFLGIGHMNCIMCHDGRRHLDPLSVWGKSATRFQGYQLSAFFAKTVLTRVRLTETANPYYWAVEDNVRRADYTLNTTTGNRPARTVVGTVRVVTPEYPFSGLKPAAGENYRVVAAGAVTGDFQFARATVNYIWKELMTKGMVEPVNQFDPARLDPDNPPAEPWKLQPNQPRLLNALARSFIESKYDLRSLMRTIVMSEAYQLSSRYEGKWEPAWENLYARHLPRRMWGETIHDAITQSSGMPASYDIQGIGVINSAMKLPDVKTMPAGAMGTWLDSFMRGNRDTEDRRNEGSTLQVLNLMNDSFVLSRTKATGRGETSNQLMRLLNTSSDEQLVSALFLNVLSRYPTEQEKTVSLAALKEGNRQAKAEDLMWALYNKVDFFFNY